MTDPIARHHLTNEVEALLSQERPLVFVYNEPCDYESTATFQALLVDWVHTQHRKAPILLLLEHPLVLTLGRGTDQALAAGVGMPVVRSMRGGSITVHGPGQLIGYCIVNLRTIGETVHGFVRRLEHIMQGTLADLGITSETRKGLTGLWTEQGKIGSIGIAVRRGITWHGFSLYLDDQEENFGGLNPCALPGVRPDAIRNHKSVDPDALQQAVLQAYDEAFQQQDALRVQFSHVEDCFTTIDAP